jgi:PKD domain
VPSRIRRTTARRNLRLAGALVGVAQVVVALLLPVTATATPLKSLPPKALPVRSLSASGVLGDVPVQNIPGPPCGPANFIHYPLGVPGATVTVYNYSCFSSAPGSNLNTLIYRADEGTVSRSPEATSYPGLMADGDVVVVTPYTIYWISVTSSLGVSEGRAYTGSGLIAGEWPIAPSGPHSYQPVFGYTVGPGNWAPNWLLPGSTGTGISGMVNGLGVRVVPSCGTDASSTPGVGTFVIQGTGDQPSFQTPPSPASDPYEHLFQFSGLLTQEDTNGNTVMTDCAGHQTTIGFVLTYRFHDALDPRSAYGGITSESRLNRVEVAITPVSSDIQISDFGVGDDLQTEGGGLPIPQTMTDTGDALQRYVSTGDRCGYDNAVYPAGAQASLCDQSPALGEQTTLIQESDPLQAENYPAVHGLAPGNVSAFISPGGAYALSYLHPSGFSPSLPALRDSLVWNTSLGGVSSAETQWVSVTDPPVTLPRGATVDVAQDQDLAQDLNPASPSLLTASPSVVPTQGGTVTLNTSTLAGYDLTSQPVLDIVASAASSSDHTVTIPRNDTGEPITYTFALNPRTSVFTPDAPHPVAVLQPAAPVAAFTAQPGALPAAPLQLNSTSFENGGTISSYLWHFGDGGTATGPVAHHVFPAPGTYSVTLTVTDSHGQQATSANMVRVTRGGHLQRHVRRPQPPVPLSLWARLRLYLPRAAR